MKGDEHIKSESFGIQIPLPSSTRKKKGYMKKKNTRIGRYFTCWVELDSLHQEICYYSDDPSIGMNSGHLKGYISLEDATFESLLSNKYNRAKVVIRKSSKIIAEFLTESFEEAEEWVDCIQSTKEFSMTTRQLAEEWKRNNILKYMFKSDTDFERIQNTSIYRDFNEEDYDLHIDLLATDVEDLNGVKRSFNDILGDHICVILLFRQFGCPSLRQMASSLQWFGDFLEEQGVQLIGIGTGSVEGAIKFKKEFSFPGDIYIDRQKILYNMTGCRNGLKYCLSLDSLNCYKKFITLGYKPGPIDGDILQLGGSLVYARHCGIIYKSIDKSIGLINSLNDITSAIWKYQRDYPDKIWTTPTNLDLGIFSTSSNPDECLDTGQPYHYERGYKYANHDSQILSYLFYKDYFYHKDHELWVRKLPADYNIQSDDIGPVIIAVNIEKNNDRTALVFHKSNTTRRYVYAGRCNTDKEYVKYITLKLFGKELSLKRIPLTIARDELVQYEKKILSNNFKFGVLLARHGEIKESQIYMNKEPIPDFIEFMNILGNKIELKNWNGYSGGLDSKADRTGTHSYFTEYQGNEIMFHVSTMIPNSDGEKSISQKRYIGNDVVVIIFQEGDEKLNISEFRSQFNHIFAIVRKEQVTEKKKVKNKYRVQIISKPDVPPSPPYLPDPPLYDIGPQFKDVFLTKLINLERTTMLNVPIFKQKFQNVRGSLLMELSQLLTKKDKKDSGSGKNSPRGGAPLSLSLSSKKLKKDKSLDISKHIKENSQDVSPYKGRKGPINVIQSPNSNTSNTSGRKPTSRSHSDKEPSKSEIKTKDPRRQISEKSMSSIISSNEKQDTPDDFYVNNENNTKSAQEIHRMNFNIIKKRWDTLLSDRVNLSSPKKASPRSKKDETKLKRTESNINAENKLRRLIVINKNNEKEKDIIGIEENETIEGLYEKISKEMGYEVLLVEFTGVQLKSKHIPLLKDCDSIQVTFKA